MNKLTLIACLASTTFFMSCSNDDDNSTNVNAPETYTFTREGATSVNYGGQTTRIQMGEEFIVALKDNTKIEYYPSLQIRKTNNKEIIVKYLQTTTGRVILNYTIQKILNFL